MIQIYRHKNLLDLDNNLVSIFTHNLKLKKKRILVSGGTTFRPMFDKLSKLNISYSKLSLTLSDERLVPDESSLSNQFWIKKLFLNKVKIRRNNIIKLYENYDDNYSIILNKANQNIAKEPIDLGLLGVGIDGHIASIFENQHVIKQSKKFLIVKKSDEDFYRISHNIQSLLSLPMLVIVFRGKEKSDMFYSSIFTFNKTNKKYENIVTLKKLIKLYRGEMVILTN